ncbi:MAG: HAMP domain-containing histidine kinase [Elusimicrobia bacterium]|nr:HAMP domain-containing histidine kinase [Elusimicrobiota bacterium]
MIPDIWANDVLAMVAHDLRNPLTCIEGYATTLQLVSMSEDEKEQVIHRILSCTRWASVLVNDLMDAVAVEQGRLSMHRQAVTLDSVLDEAAQGFEIVCREKRIHLKLLRSKGPFLVMADPIRIRQVLHNLISNAVKHVGPEGHILVSAHHSGSKAVIEVMDNGAGIDPKDQPHLFEKFFRRGEPSRGSLGLGLYIAHAIVEAHEGAIGVRSDGLGKGATFHFTLPIFKPEEAYLQYKKAKRSDTPLPRKLSAQARPGLLDGGVNGFSDGRLPH